MTTIPTIDLVDALAAEYADKSPSEILALALNQTGETAISFSGAEDVVLIDMAANLGKPFRVFSLDTGRLHTETYQLSRLCVNTTISISKFVSQKQMPFNNWSMKKVYSAFIKMIIKSVVVSVKFSLYVKN